jgi:hypothetical protein
MNKKGGLAHTHVFLHAVRTAVIFVAGFLIYDILVKIEKEWNKKNPSGRAYHFSKRKIIKFLLILIIDMILLYILYLVFGVNF